jgi:hypothetical protein
VATGGVAVGAALPATRGFFDDRRLSDVGHAEAVCHVALRIPLATALAEELLFRGALLALLRRRAAGGRGGLWTSLLFGAWHVLPTIDHCQGNAASALVADVGRGRRLAVLTAMLSTTGAGGVFAWLRLRSHSVLAPVLAHAAVNMSAYLAGRWSSASGEKWTSTVSSGRRTSAPARAASTRRSGSVSGGWTRLRGHNLHAQGLQHGPAHRCRGRAGEQPPPWHPPSRQHLDTTASRSRFSSREPANDR